MKQVSFTVTDAESNVINAIVDRIERLYAERRRSQFFDRLSSTMDITACHANGCRLKLQELLEADDFNFAHDIFGIQRHLNRDTGELMDCFLPRFAA